MMPYYFLKTSVAISLKASLCISIAFSPTLAFGASAQTNIPKPEANGGQASDQQAAGQAQIRTDEPLKRALELALNGSAKTYTESFDAAMDALATGDIKSADQYLFIMKEAEKYLLNGVSASALAGLLSPTLTRRLINMGNKTNNNWLDTSINTSKIEQAINQAKQLTITESPPSPLDIPGGLTLPAPINLNPTNPLSPLSSEQQIQRLVDLMNSNSELRTLLWQTAEERLQTSSFIGANPPAYLPANQNSNINQGFCNQGASLCQIFNIFNAGNTDYVTPIALLKNEFYGYPLDNLAQNIIHDKLWVTELAAFAGSFLKAYPTIKNNSTPTYWGQVIPDWGANGVLFFVIYSMLGRMAALYNYPLAQDEQMAMFLFIVAATGAALPAYLATDGRILDPARSGESAVNSPFLRFGGKMMARARILKTSFASEVEKQRLKHPEINQKIKNGVDFFRRQKAILIAEENAELERLKKLAEEKPAPEAKAALAKPSKTSKPIAKGFATPIEVNTGTAPIEGGVKVIESTDAKPKGGLALQILWMTLKGTGRAITYREFAVLVGVLANGMFRNYYTEHRRMQNEKFRLYMMGGANTAFLKLLVLSQNPSKLALKIVTPTPPINQTPGTPGFPSTPGSNPFPTSNPKSDPNGVYFPFAETIGPQNSSANQIKISSPESGGLPAKFILNYARSLHICSVHDINLANQKVNEIRKLLNSKPTLAKFNDWHEAPKDDSLIREFEIQHTKDIPGLFSSKILESLAEAVKEKEIDENQAKDILLVHDCRGRANATIHEDLIKDMVSFSSFSDADIAKLRTADAFIRLRMAELILQILYLNGPTGDKIRTYAQNVQRILAVDGVNFINYFNFYEGKLAESFFVKDPYSQTGYRLESSKQNVNRPEGLKSTNPYDLTIMDEWRPDEPQSLHPIPRPNSNANTNSTFPGGGTFGQGGGSGSTGGFPFNVTIAPMVR